MNFERIYKRIRDRVSKIQITFFFFCYYNNVPEKNRNEKKTTVLELFFKRPQIQHIIVLKNEYLIKKCNE
jgi:hypothetical protein